MILNDAYMVHDLLTSSNDAVKHAIVILHERQVQNKMCHNINVYYTCNYSHYALRIMSGYRLTDQELDEIRIIALEHIEQLIDVDYDIDDNVCIALALRKIAAYCRDIICEILLKTHHGIINMMKIFD